MYTNPGINFEEQKQKSSIHLNGARTPSPVLQPKLKAEGRSQSLGMIDLPKFTKLKANRVYSNSISSVKTKVGQRMNYALELIVQEIKNIDNSAEESYNVEIQVNNASKFNTTFKSGTGDVFWAESTLLYVDESFRVLNVLFNKEKSSTVGLKDVFVKRSVSISQPATVLPHLGNSNETKQTKSKLLGNVQFPIGYLENYNEFHEDWYYLKPAINSASVSGFIEVRSLYNESTDGGDDELTLFLSCGRDLVSKDANGLSDPFAVWGVVPDYSLATFETGPVHHKTLNPDFNVSRKFKINAATKAIYIAIWDYDRFSSADFMGEVVIPIQDFKALGSKNKRTHHILQPMKKNSDLDYFGSHVLDKTKLFTSKNCDFCSSSIKKAASKCKNCKANFHEECAEKEIIGACHKEMDKKDLAVAFPLVAKLEDQSKQNIHFLKYQNVFLEELTRNYNPELMLPAHKFIKQKTKNNTCSECKKEIGPMPNKCVSCSSVVHDHCIKSDVRNCGAVGQIRLKFRYLKEIILEGDEYNDFFRVIREEKFFCMKMLNLVIKERDDAAVAIVMGAFGKQKLNETMVGLVKLDLATLVSAGGDGTLFRSNSLGTKAYDKFLNIFGSYYLIQTLKPVIEEIISSGKSSSKSCEMDPTRCKKNEFKENEETLKGICKLVLKTIFESVNKIPFQIRKQLFLLREVIDATLPTKNENNQYLGISSFFFLRFICPAILNPHLFGIVDGMPSENNRRNLTLISKVIQKIANLAGFEEKEPYMMSLNTFVQAQYPQMKKFLIEISTIPEESSILSTQILSPVEIDTPKQIARTYSFFARYLEDLKAKMAEAEEPYTARQLTVIRELEESINVLDKKTSTIP